MAKKVSKEVMRRRLIQWCLVPVVLVTIGLGWKYPLLGFSVPVVMALGMVGGIFRGRYVCGNLCPRGSLFDRVVEPVSRNSGIPHFFRNMTLRWSIFAAMMGFMVYRILQNPSEITHWGRVFWLMCTITTSIGLVLGIALHPRAWCAFCPMGTLQNVLGGHKHQLTIRADACRECRLCEKACPFSISIVEYKLEGRLLNPDCLKCPECIAACPGKALAWPSRGKGDAGDTPPGAA